MNSTNNNLADDSQVNQKNHSSNTSLSPISTGAKEVERIKTSPVEKIEEVSAEIELPKEVERAGVERIKDTIELPKDIERLGVTSQGPQTPVSATGALPSITLPISDPQVISGLHAQLTQSLKWLAIWCLRKLKKAHLKLKNFHGKIIRVKQ